MRHSSEWNDKQKLLAVTVLIMIVYSQRRFVLEKFGSFFLVGFCAHCYYAQAIHLALLSHRICISISEVLWQNSGKHVHSSSPCGDDLNSNTK